MSIFSWKGRVSKSAFRERYIDALLARFPQLSTELEDEYGVVVKGIEGYDQQSVWLERAYKEFIKDPKKIEDVIQRWLAPISDVIETSTSSMQLDFVIPVIKRNTWIDEQRALIQKQHGTGTKVEYLSEQYNSELSLVFTVYQKSIWYPAPSEFEATGKSLDELRAIGIQNLRARVKELLITENDEPYLVSCGGTIDPSLLLCDDLWLNDPRLQIQGDVVAGVPDRDSLVVCGTENIEAVFNAAMYVADLYKSESHPISKLLFIKSNDRYETVDDGSNDDSHPIPNLDVIDVYLTLKGGGASLGLVMATPLQADVRSMYRLFRKIDSYLQFIASPDHEDKCGKATPENTRIDIAMHKDTAPVMLEFIRSLDEWIATGGATLTVRMLDENQGVLEDKQKPPLRLV